MAFKDDVYLFLERFPEMITGLINHANFDSLPSFNHFERYLNDGFSKYGYDLSRIPVFTKMMLDDIGYTDSIENVFQLMRDIEDLRHILPVFNPPLTVATATPVSRKFTLTPHRDFEKFFIRNFSIASARKQSFDVVMRYIHNNHLAAVLVRQADSFIGDMKFITDDSVFQVILEDIDMMDITSTIPDLSLLTEKARFFIKNGDIQETIAENIDLKITFDSKYVKNPSSLSSSKVIEQQFKQQFGSASPVVSELFAQIRKNKPGQSIAESIETMMYFSPSFITHYVFVPQNYPVPESLNSLFASRFKELGRSEFIPVLDEMGITAAADRELFFSLLDKQLDSHFGSGRFIINSDMTHKMLEDL